MNTHSRIRLAFIIMAVCMVLALCFTAVTSRNVKGEVRLTGDALVPDTDGWFTDTPSGPRAVTPGSEVSVEGGSFTMYKTVSILPDEHNNVLFFSNGRQSVSVTADGEVIYALGTDTEAFRFSTLADVTATLPGRDTPYRLEITFTRLEGDTLTLPDISFCSMNDIFVLLIVRDFSSLFLLPVWIIAGIALLLLAIAEFPQNRPEAQVVIALAMFMASLAVWNITDTNLAAAIVPNPELNSALIYLVMMCMPIPVQLFIRWTTYTRHLLFRRGLMLASVCNVVVQTLLFMTGTASFYAMLPFTHSILFVSLSYGIFASFSEHRTQRTRISLLRLMAYVFSLAMGVPVVFIFWLIPDGINLYRGFFSCAVLLFFLCTLAAEFLNLIEQRIAAQLKDAEINSYRLISTVDELSGLNNRRAFDLKLDEIRADPGRFPNARLVFMDVNGLKYANDQFGHDAGDELIIAASWSILAGFGSDGTAYRIGGDEFAVILLGESADVLECYERMDAFIAEYNTTASVPLSVARGCSDLQTIAGRQLSISEWKSQADKRMYADKARRQRPSATGREEDYLEIISGFIRAVDAKDAYTANHSQRVAEIALRICGMLGLSESVTETVHTAAYMHDIGKISIPDTILCKKGELTEEEWVIMRRHSTFGEDIVKYTRGFAEISRIIRHHHERLDGLGYPDGLRGEDIPLGSRIVFVADTIDSVTTSHGYREARSVAFCREELQKHAGTQYDAAIVAAVLEHWSEIEEVVLTYD